VGSMCNMLFWEHTDLQSILRITRIEPVEEKQLKFKDSIKIVKKEKQKEREREGEREWECLDQSVWCNYDATKIYYADVIFNLKSQKLSV